MRSFRNAQRVMVIAEDSPLKGRSGVVRRLRRGDDGAWVEMDDDLPEVMQSFPADDVRHRHVILYPEDCR